VGDSGELVLVPVGGGTYHFDNRVFPCRFCNKKKRIIFLNYYLRVFVVNGALDTLHGLYCSVRKYWSMFM